MTARFMFSLCLLIGGGCVTSFTGPAEIQGGRPGCERKCASVGLEMQAFVFMGEYSTACVCEAPGRTPETGGSSPAAAAVSFMMHLRDAQNQHCQMHDCGRF